VTPEFRRLLDKGRKLFVREMIDGCVDCSRKGFVSCVNHRKVSYDITLHPSKYLKVTAKGVDYTDEGLKALGIEAERHVEGGKEPTQG
jgi:hypothetical protein